MARLRIAALVFLLAPRAAWSEPEARFEPPSSVEPAQTRYERGKKLFQAKQYAAAAEEFSAAYDLDPQAKFLLFNLGVARRMAGSCQAAIDAYRAFLAAAPPDALGDNARIGIERCEKIVASLPPAPPEPPRLDPGEAAKVQPVPEPSAPPQADVRLEVPGVVVTDTMPWYRDSVGDVLTGSGAVAAIASGTLYVLARRAADTSRMPKSLPEFVSSRSDAENFQTASIITGAAAVVLIGGGIVRYATRSHRHPIAIVPTSGGAALSFGGGF